MQTFNDTADSKNFQRLILCNRIPLEYFIDMYKIYRNVENIIIELQYLQTDKNIILEYPINKKVGENVLKCKDKIRITMYSSEADPLEQWLTNPYACIKGYIYKKPIFDNDICSLELLIDSPWLQGFYYVVGNNEQLYNLHVIPSKKSTNSSVFQISKRTVECLLYNDNTSYCTRPFIHVLKKD